MRRRRYRCACMHACRTRSSCECTHNRRRSTPLRQQLRHVTYYHVGRCCACRFQRIDGVSCCTAVSRKLGQLGAVARAVTAPAVRGGLLSQVRVIILRASEFGGPGGAHGFFRACMHVRAHACSCVVMLNSRACFTCLLCSHESTPVVRAIGHGRGSHHMCSSRYETRDREAYRVSNEFVFSCAG